MGSVQIKKIAIYYNSINNIDIKQNSKYIIKISNLFITNGYDVYLFIKNNGGIKSINERFKIFDSKEILNACNNIGFDYVFLNENLKGVNEITNCKNIYYISHNSIIYNFDFSLINKLSKIICCSDFHKNVLINKYNIPDNKIVVINDFIDNISLYHFISKENKMIYSGGNKNGLRWLIENVFPKIKSEVSDFELYVYGDEGIKEIEIDGIYYLHYATRTEIIKKQCESKIWICPNHGYNNSFDDNNSMFYDDAIENMAAKNACILGDWGCISSIFENYDGFVGKYLYASKNEPIDYDKLDDFAEELAKEAIKCLKDEEYRQNKIKQTYGISFNYNSDNTIKKFEKMFENDNKSVMIYEISHKDFPYLIHDDIHKVLQVGAEINGNLGIGLCDNVGNNISEKNKYFTDTTGIYWIWKNSTYYDYIGNQAYRRDFRLSKDEIIDILNKYDVIASPVNLGISIYDHYKGCHIIKDLDTCSDIIDELYPEYKGKFSEFMKTKEKLYIGCGYITSYEKYNGINEFVFSVLFELEKRYGFKTYEEWFDYASKSGQNSLPEDHRKNGMTSAEYQSRIFGALYEKLFTFYVCENFSKIYEKEYVRLDKKYKSDKLRTLLCCIGRLENKYIREFVEYYKNIGFTNICLYDNNRDEEEDFRDVIGDYINNGFVILKNYRNVLPPCQAKAYNECYFEYRDKYDWIAFFDIDEFLVVNYDNVKQYLSDEVFDDFDMIHINWRIFGDGGKTYYENKPVFERIKNPIDINSKTNYNFPDNFHIKSIVRGGLDIFSFINNVHTPFIKGKCCNGTGIQCDGNSPFNPYDYRKSAILHFTTKTAEEFANKVNMGFCDWNKIKKDEMIKQFFLRNEVTKEKINIFKEKCGIDMSYLLPSEFNGEKNNDIKIYSLCYSKKNFKFLDDSVVTPLQVGAANGTDVCKLKDNTGDNISDLNYFYIENTGIYWIWKNINDAKYKGQMQYRRPLEGVDETMDFDKIFEKYDVITCKPFNHPENSKPTEEQPMCIPANTVEEGYAFSNCRDDLSLMEMLIKYRFSDYAEDYDKYIKHGENLYYSNGFIMKSEDYNKYCEFLFECLGLYLKSTNIKTKDDLEKHVKYNIETGKYIRYKEKKVSPEAFKWQTEIGGFLSERIWTLWLLHNFKKERIYELPYVKMENNMYI